MDTLQAKLKQTHRENKKIRTKKKGKQMQFKDLIINNAKDKTSNNKASNKEDKKTRDVRVYIRYRKIIKEGTNKKKGKPNSKRETNIKIKSNFLLTNKEVKLVSHN